MRITQAPVEILEKFGTLVRVTQSPIEVLERFDSNVRLTQFPVEVMYKELAETICAACGDYHNTLPPPPRVRPTGRIGGAISTAPVKGNAKKATS